jgi:hypothetical protein
MRTIIAALTLAAFHATAFGDSLRLLVVCEEVNIKANSSVRCDLYLYNDSDARCFAPSFETVATILALHDVNGVRLPRGDSSSLVTGHASGKQRLEARAVKRTTITVKIPAEVGDLVELYVEVGGDPVVRSNKILLFCPSDEKQEGN